MVVIRNLTCILLVYDSIKGFKYYFPQIYGTATSEAIGNVGQIKESPTTKIQLFEVS